jgi:cytochrome c-type biogenesis protein CcmF
MPWLAGTALIHSLAVTEKRGAFKSWTVFLAIAAFSLSLLGAFIVRSGILTSVHAFAVDPERGLYLLAFLVVAVGGALVLYGLRAPAIRARAQYWGLSRELMLLGNNMLLVLALAVILIYTLYPVAYEAITAGEKKSIGPPYYNRTFVPLALLLAAVLAAMPVSRWRRTPVVLFRNVGLMLLVAVALGVLLPLALGGSIAVGAALAVGLGLWIAMTHATDIRKRRRSLTRSYLGMVIAHLGFAVSLIGIGVTSEFSHVVDARMALGDSVTLTEDYGAWWSYIPHFVHTPGYVYAYSFGELLVLALYARYQEVGASFADSYVEMLATGGSDWPHRIMQPLGVDLTDPGFWDRGLAMVEQMVEQAEELAGSPR